MAEQQAPQPKTYGYVVGKRPSEQEHPDKKTEQK